MKQSLRMKILEYLTGRGWVHSIILEKKAMDWGYKAETCGRQCRKLAQWGLIDRKIENKCVWYREIPEPEAEPVKMPFNQLQFI